MIKYIKYNNDKIMIYLDKWYKYKEFNYNPFIHDVIIKNRMKSEILQHWIKGKYEKVEKIFKKINKIKKKINKKKTL